MEFFDHRSNVIENNSNVMYRGNMYDHKNVEKWIIIRKGLNMPSKKPRIQVLMNENTYQKFRKICEKEKRTDSNLGEYIIEKFINQYEKENGIIEITE